MAVAVAVETAGWFKNNNKKSRDFDTFYEF